MSSSPVASLVKKSTGLSIGLSIFLIVVGMLAIALPAASGIAVEVFVAWMLVLSGVIHLAFSWFTRTTGGFIWELLVGILYIFIGAYLMMHPAAGLAALTLALAIYLLAEAILEFVLGLALRPLPGSSWLFVDAVVTLVLAVLIWRTWPSSTEWVIGTLVGISMIFSGASRLGLSLAARRIATKLA
jgi:uncharacterized membrane protein HdeD (DUF308 family)